MSKAQLIKCPKCNGKALLKTRENDVSIECFNCDYIYRDGVYNKEHKYNTTVEDYKKDMDIEELNNNINNSDIENAWGYLKQDLLDVIAHSSRFKNTDYDIKGVSEQISKLLLYQMLFYEDIIGKEPERNDYRLKGWDWGELATAFGLEEYDNENHYDIYASVDDPLLFNQVENFIRDNFRNREVITTIKEHLRKMIRNEGKPTHYDAVWQGMLNIEDDVVFMQFVIAFLGHMWT